MGRRPTGKRARSAPAAAIAVRLLAAGLALCGCKRQEPGAPLAPGGGGGTAQPSGGGQPRPPDAGTDDAGAGAGAISVRAAECFELDPGTLTVTSPTDFTPTHTAATWLSDCREPTIFVALSEGSCPSGAGHELAFFIEPQAVRDGRLFLGNNPLGATALGGLTIRYWRAAPDTPAGQWGNCAGSDGSVDIERLAPETAGQVSLRFSLLLSDCTAGGAVTQALEGTLSVFLARSEATACPE